MRFNSQLPLFAFLLLLSVPCVAFDSSGYQAASFAAWEDTVRDSEGFPERAKNFLYDAEFPKLATTVEYTGHSRKITAGKSQFIAYFARTVLEKPELAAQYADEIEVREQGKSYWVCVRTADWPAQSRRLKAGARIKLYQRFAGVAKGMVFVYLLSDLKI